MMLAVSELFMLGAIGTDSDPAITRPDPGSFTSFRSPVNP